jgi:hypothetical protein
VPLAPFAKHAHACAVPRGGRTAQRTAPFNIGVTETNTSSAANQSRVQARRLTCSFRYPKGTNRVRYTPARYTNRTRLALLCTQSASIPRPRHIRHRRNCIPVATSIRLSCKVPRSSHPPADRNSACRLRDSAQLSDRSQRMRSTRQPQSQELGCSFQNHLATPAFAVPHHGSRLAPQRADCTRRLRRDALRSDCSDHSRRLAQ